jgi:hypothetical protein
MHRFATTIALVMLFLVGSWLARHGGYRPLRTGFYIAALGVVLVAITIALGG